MNKRTNLSVLALLCLSLSGCHLLHKDDDIPRDWLGREVEIEYTVPSKVVAIWSNSVFNQGGDAPRRGLGGRVYFYNDEHSPVQVNGSLSVYVYDDTDARPNDKLKQEASRVVHFDAEEVKDNFTPSEFGASYSFWVPWDNVGGDRKQLSIIPVFTDATGNMIVGEQARQLLPGKEPVEVTDEYGNTIVQASHTTKYTERVKITGDTGPRSNQSYDSAPRRVTSEKIHLPESMQKRLSQPKRKSWDINEWSKFDNSRIRSSIPQGESVRHADHAQTGQASDQFNVTPAQAISTSTQDANRNQVKPLGSLRDDTARSKASPEIPKITADEVRKLMKNPAAARETVETGLRPQPARRTSMFPSSENRNPLSSRKPLFEK